MAARTARVTGQATITALREVVGTDSGDDSWVVGVPSALWGNTRYELVLEVALPGLAPYPVQGTWKAPNRMGSLRRSIVGGRKLRVGVVLPVLVRPDQLGDVDIDWDGFIDSGAVKQLDGPGLLATVRDVAKDIRSIGAPTAGPGFQPEHPRPTASTHPPIEGVDFDRWIGALRAMLTSAMPPDQHEAHFASWGFPPGRGQAVSQAWYVRANGDVAVGEWYRAELGP